MRWSSLRVVFSQRTNSTVISFTDTKYVREFDDATQWLKATVPDRRAWLLTHACVIVAVHLSKAPKDAHSKGPSNLHVRAGRFHWRLHLGNETRTLPSANSNLLLWGGRLALRYHRSFSATSYCWLFSSEGSICRIDKVLNKTRCSWVAEDVCSIRSDADLAQFRQQDCALCVVLRTNQ